MQHRSVFPVPYHHFVSLQTEPTRPVHVFEAATLGFPPLELTADTMRREPESALLGLLLNFQVADPSHLGAVGTSKR